MAEMVGFPLRQASRIASASQKYFALLIFLGRQVLTRWVLIHTTNEKNSPSWEFSSWRGWWDFRFAKLRGLLPPAKNISPCSYFWGVRYSPGGFSSTPQMKKTPHLGSFLHGGDGGISASPSFADCFRQPKIFRLTHIFGASGTHPVGSHPHHK
ncbi:MAG: hypothetical protein E7482_03600 [Ruminococcaceae bacterium]|nr:hypothetical protein [Oscillospiraceae bacterium]